MRHVTGATLAKSPSIFDRERHVTPGWQSTHSPQFGLPPASWQPPRLLPGFGECGEYPFLVALGGWNTGPPCCSASCLFRLNDAPVAHVNNLRRSAPGGRVDK